MKNKKYNGSNTCKCPPSPRLLCRNYSDTKTINLLHHPYFITGFADGEGCFWINIFRDKNCKTGWRVKLFFQINLNKKDYVLLEQIQNYFCAGKIYKNKNSDSIQYQVSSVKDLQLIQKHFDKYPLHTKKRADFELWKKAFDLIQNKEHLTPQG